MTLRNAISHLTPSRRPSKAEPKPSDGFDPSDVRRDGTSYESPPGVDPLKALTAQAKRFPPGSPERAHADAIVEQAKAWKAAKVSAARQTIEDTS